MWTDDRPGGPPWDPGILGTHKGRGRRKLLAPPGKEVLSAWEEDHLGGFGAGHRRGSPLSPDTPLVRRPGWLRGRPVPCVRNEQGPRLPTADLQLRRDRTWASGRVWGACLTLAACSL